MVLLNVKATACPAYPSSYVGYFRLEQAMKLKLAEDGLWKALTVASATRPTGLSR